MKRRVLKTIQLSFWLAAAIVCGASCRGSQSALDAAGLQSGRLESLWWLFFGVCATVYLIVMAVLLTAFFRARREDTKSDAQTAPDVSPDNARENRLGTIIKAAVGVTLVALFFLMIASFRTGRAINSLAAEPAPILIKITGRQWWWEAEYTDEANPSNNISTANEIHVPVNRPIKLILRSTDVIHSFWVPNLHGKKDLIPNFQTSFMFEADKPGVYWGQCAEYCGYQHAHMRLAVVAESPEDFNNWMKAQQQSSAQPATDLQKRGQEVFLTTTCASCHTIQGTTANGRVGPNLTHLASKMTLGAGRLPNTKEHLSNWITDPQAAKPGIRMPQNTYTNEDLEALTEYLQSLK